MRSILVAALVVVMASWAGSAAGEMSEDGVGTPPQPGGAVHFANPSTQVIEEEHHDGAAEFGLALAATGLSLVYNPFRFVFGVIGAELGGIGGWSTGGDLRTAKGLWRPTVEGDYYIRPDQLDGTETFRFNGTMPVHERHTVLVRERVVAGTPRVSEPRAPSDSSDLVVPESGSEDTTSNDLL